MAKRDREDSPLCSLHYVIRERLTYREGYGMRLVTGILLSVGIIDYYFHMVLEKVLGKDERS
jgi:hypothetical protein